MKHITNSKEAKAFLKECGIAITKGSAFNSIVLKNQSGKTITLVAESQHQVAGGIPGIFTE